MISYHLPGPQKGVFMLFYRDDTISAADEKTCPICAGEIRKSFVWVMLHDVGAMIDFAVMALAVAALLFFAVYQITVRLDLEITIPELIGWFRGAQIVVMLFGAAGAVVSHFLMAMYLKASYRKKGYSLEGSRYCPKCGNRFLVLIPNNSDANLHQQEDLE